MPSNGPQTGTFTTVDGLPRSADLMQHLLHCKTCIDAEHLCPDGQAIVDETVAEPWAKAMAKHDGFLLRPDEYGK